VERILAGAGTNQTVKGWVLDLRFLSGRDFAAAAQIADAFIPAGKPLMDWGQGLFVSSEKPSDKDKLPPLTVLVNRQTRGAAEAIAAVLRGAGSALVIGGATAGEVARYEEFALSNGRKLRLAVAPVKGADGSFLAPTGVQPDIGVSVPEAEEQGWMEDPFGSTGVAAPAGGASGTNSVAKPRRRLTEADLVRARREGKSGTQGTNAVATPAPVTPPVRVVRDPSLARALDLLKGLSVIRTQ
jgi:C-terminal processing protease CtpA/Prc